ncbi:MAG TPA: transcriptional repressor, partial [bacterium]|nr:transcriptional repressor [bacterium]
MATTAPRRYNYSRQREVIYRILAGTTCHPTAEWIFQRAKEELPQLSLGTVYRNLQILKE